MKEAALIHPLLHPPRLDSAGDVCDNQIAAGLGYPVPDGTDILKGFCDTTLAGRRADQIFHCALVNKCTACLQ
jgi:hypothetical protein